MWIVRLALRRPYTFIVMALLILMLGVASIRRTPTDIFPKIDIPVVSVVWTYNGLSTEEMERQITTFSEFATSFAVSQHQEHREPDAQRRRGHQDLLPAGRRHRRRDGAGHRRRADDPAPHAAGHEAAVHRALQRVERADPPAVAQQRPAQRGRALRLRHLPHAPAAGRRAGHDVPAALRRQGRGRSRSTSIRRSSAPTASRRRT